MLSSASFATLNLVQVGVAPALAHECVFKAINYSWPAGNEATTIPNFPTHTRSPPHPRNLLPCSRLHPLCPRAHKGRGLHFLNRLPRLPQSESNARRFSLGKNAKPQLSASLWLVWIGGLVVKEGLPIYPQEAGLKKEEPELLTRHNQAKTQLPPSPSRAKGTAHTHTHAHTHTQTRRHTDTQTHRHTDTQAHRHTDTQAHRHTDTPTHGHTDTRTHRHTNTQTHTETHGDTRRHAETHGDTRRHTGTHGDTRGHTGTHGDTRGHTGTHGDTRGHTGTHGDTRGHTGTHGDTHGHTRTHTDTHGHTQTHTDTHGHTRTHTDTRGHTRTHTDTHGHTRTHMDTHRHTLSHTHTLTHPPPPPPPPPHPHTHTHRALLRIVSATQDQRPGCLEHCGKLPGPNDETCLCPGCWASQGSLRLPILLPCCHPSQRKQRNMTMGQNPVQ